MSLEAFAKDLLAIVRTNSPGKYDEVKEKVSSKSFSVAEVLKLIEMIDKISGGKSDKYFDCRRKLSDNRFKLQAADGFVTNEYLNDMLNLVDQTKDLTTLEQLRCGLFLLTERAALQKDYRRSKLTFVDEDTVDKLRTSIHLGSMEKKDPDFVRSFLSPQRPRPERPRREEYPVFTPGGTFPPRPQGRTPAAYLAAKEAWDKAEAEYRNGNNGGNGNGNNANLNTEMDGARNEYEMETEPIEAVTEQKEDVNDGSNDEDDANDMEG